jgi:hypothetical protein
MPSHMLVVSTHVYVLRRQIRAALRRAHGETAWTITGQHTGRIGIPLTARSEQIVRSLARRLQGVVFARVLVSPLLRAYRTCELAGCGDHAEVDPALQEWDYGQYEGWCTTDIRQERPGWWLFRDGCPGGALAGAARWRRPVFCAPHSRTEHPGLRAYTGRAGDSSLERQPPRGAGTPSTAGPK